VERHADGREIVEVRDRAAWRRWLVERHEQREAIWLVFHKKTSDGASPSYEEAVEEALCFGWIDSTVNRLDERRMLQLFAPRKPRSTWSRSNRERVARLERDGLLAPAGRAAIEVAQANGSWTALEAVERWRSELEAVGGLALTAGICDLERAGDALTLYALADRALAAARQVGPGSTERHPPVPA